MRWTQEQVDEYIEKRGLRFGDHISVASCKPHRTHKSNEGKQGIGIKVKNASQSKYCNKKVTIDGILFDSTKEANRWLQLKGMEERGEISELRRQVVFQLAPPVILDGRKKPALRYVCDFTYHQYGSMVAEDVKSPATKKLAAYRIKKHLMMSIHNVHIFEI